MKSIVLGLIFSLAALPAYSYKVIEIPDGHTLTVLVNQKPMKIRLAHIKAPPKSHPFSQASRESLLELCWGKNAYFKKRTGRPTKMAAVVTCGGVEVNREQVARGWAWAVSDRRKDNSMRTLQEQAKQRNRGVWAASDASSQVKPRLSRRRARVLSPKYSDDAICFIGARSEYKIVDGKKRFGC